MSWLRTIFAKILIGFPPITLFAFKPVTFLVKIFSSFDIKTLNIRIYKWISISVNNLCSGVITEINLLCAQLSGYLHRFQSNITCVQR